MQERIIFSIQLTNNNNCNGVRTVHMAIAYGARKKTEILSRLKNFFTINRISYNFFLFFAQLKKKKTNKYFIWIVAAVAEPDV